MTLEKQSIAMHIAILYMKWKSIATYCCEKVLKKRKNMNTTKK